MSRGLAYLSHPHSHTLSLFPSPPPFSPPPYTLRSSHLFLFPPALLVVIQPATHPPPPISSTVSREICLHRPIGEAPDSNQPTGKIMKREKGKNYQKIKYKKSPRRSSDDDSTSLSLRVGAEGGGRPRQTERKNKYWLLSIWNKKKKKSQGLIMIYHQIPQRGPACWFITHRRLTHFIHFPCTYIQ